MMNQENPREEIIQDIDPLTLDLPDDEVVSVLDNSIELSRSYYKAKRLAQRQDKLLSYYLGQQFLMGENGQPIVDSWLKVPYVENIVYEAIRRTLPIVLSQLPDVTVGSSSDDEQMIKNADILEDKLNTDAQKGDMSNVLGLAVVHEQLFLYSVTKAVWNTELGDDGDYQFLNKYPRNIVWDHTCKTNNADDMRFVAEFAEIPTLQEVLMMFPKKAEEFLAYLGITPDSEDRTKRLASPIKICECWFHWYKEVKDPETKESKWEKVHGVIWKYNTFVLGKIKNPYFDYEGKPRLFSKEVKEKGDPSVDEMFAALFGSQQTDTIYYNYFKNPRKPYYFMVYESLGEDPIDATNRLEQILYFQDHINNQGKQIIQMNEQSSGKAVANSDALDATEVKKIDWHNTSQIISVNGDDIDKTFKVFQMPPAPSQLYQSKTENRGIAFEMLGLNPATRGINEQGDQTLGETQIHREQDFGLMDHYTEETVNDLALWMAQWKMQFIRLFYTKSHFEDLMGKDGDSVYQEITQDLVSQGMSLIISASGVDKQKRMQMAVKNMEMGVGDVLTYYVDTQQSNPKERARRAFLQRKLLLCSIIKSS